MWWRVTAHLTGSLSFLQMRSIQEATRGGTLLGGSYYFFITIETNTLAFSWSRPGVHWHQLSHYSKSWQNPKWILALWIMPICVLWHQKIKRPPFWDIFYNDQKMGTLGHWYKLNKSSNSSQHIMMGNVSTTISISWLLFIFPPAVYAIVNLRLTKQCLRNVKKYGCLSNHTELERTGKYI